VAIWSRIQGFIFGGAVATAASDGVRPVLEPVRQHAWTRNQVRVLEPSVAAQLRAQGLIDDAAAHDEASRNGIGPNRLNALVQMLLTTPGVAELDHMLNRKTINRAQFNHALAKHQIEPQYWDALYDLTNDRLSVADVAAAVQQGHLPNEGILPDIQPDIGTPTGYIQPPAPDGFPPSDVPLTTIAIDPIDEAAADGYDLSRLKVRANLSGLPPGPHDLLQMWNRNEITEEAVDAGIREGHMKTKWAQAFKRMRWAVLSASEYANAYIRAWITHDEMLRGGALTGHTPEQMELMYRNRGRPLSPTQAYNAWARQAPHPDIPGEPHRGGTFDETDFDEAIRRSDIQTWYAPILWHNRFAYPSLFQLGRLAQARALTPERVRTILGYQRYEPQDIDAFIAFWFGGTAGTTTDAHVTKAQTQLWNALHTAYVKSQATDQQARATLSTIGVPTAAIRTVLTLWRDERALTRSTLTAATVKKAYREGVTNPATNHPWTQDEALAYLIELGYSGDDARTFLEI